MRRRNRPMKATKIEIIPMIDTMFFLLVFFLLSALNVINLESIGLNLPKENNAATQTLKNTPPPITVAITNAGGIFVNNRSVQAEEVGQAVLDAATAEERIKEKKPDASLTVEEIHDMSIVISAQDKVKHGVVVSCIDSARQKGIERFAIAVDQTIVPQP